MVDISKYKGFSLISYFLNVILNFKYTLLITLLNTKHSKVGEKGFKNCIHTKIKQNKTGMAMLISDKIDFRRRNFTRVE